MYQRNVSSLEKEVFNYSPSIANKNALSTSNYTPEEIAQNLKNLLNTGAQN